MPKVNKNNDGTYSLTLKTGSGKTNHELSTLMSRQDVIIFFNTEYGPRNNAHNEINKLNKN